MYFSPVVRDLGLGVLIDSRLTFGPHIYQVCRIPATINWGSWGSFLVPWLLRLLSPSFMHLCSAALTIAVTLRWSNGVRMEKLRCHGSTGLRRDSLVGSVSLTTYPNICGMYCTGFHSHSASNTGSRPWYGDAYLAGRPPFCANFAVHSVLVQAVVHRGTLSKAMVAFSRSVTMQSRSFSVADPTKGNGRSVDLRHLKNGACSQCWRILTFWIYFINVKSSVRKICPKRPNCLVSSPLAMDCVQSSMSKCKHSLRLIFWTLTGKIAFKGVHVIWLHNGLVTNVRECHLRLWS